MATHVFMLESWFMNRNGDWSSGCEYLVIHNGLIETRPSGSGATYYQDKLCKEFPAAHWHDEALSLHRGKLEPKGLQGLDVKVLAMLSSRFAIKDVVLPAVL
jgi:hypothetical protein